MSRWPDFFHVGAAKSGTTTLFHHLKDHPSVFMPSLKEPWFFTFAGAPDGHLCARDKGTIIRDEQRYLNLLQKARSHQLTGEASPIYRRCPLFDYAAVGRYARQVQHCGWSSPRSCCER